MIHYVELTSICVRLVVHALYDEWSWRSLLHYLYDEWSRLSLLHYLGSLRVVGIARVAIDEKQVGARVR